MNLLIQKNTIKSWRLIKTQLLKYSLQIQKIAIITKTGENMGLFWASAVVLIIIFLYKTVFKTIRTCIKFRKVYGDKAIIKFYPVIESFKQHDHAFYFLNKEMMKHPEAKVMLFLSDNSCIKKFYQVASNQKKLEDTFGTEALFYDGLIQSSGDLWKNSRKFLNPFFHFKQISEMIDPMKESAKHFLENEKNLQDYQKIDAFYQLRHIAALSVQNVFFGYTGEAIKSNNLPFHQELLNILQEVFSYSQKPFFMLKTFFFGSRKATRLMNTQQEKGYLKRIQNLKEISIQFIDNRLSQLQEIDIKEFQPKSMIDIYLKQYIINQNTVDKSLIEDHHKIINKEHIIKQFYSFLLAGTDTSSLTLTYLLYHLSVNPDIKEKVIEEITSHTSSNFDEITFDQINKLDYTSKVIKEVLRLHAPTPFIIPRLLEKNINEDGLFLEKGMIISCRLINSSKFDDFYKFNPNRFDDVSQLDTFDYIPFSAGQRNCIGQHFGLIETKLFLIYILKNFDIQPIEDYKLKIKLAVFPVPEDPYLIKMKRLVP